MSLGVIVSLIAVSTGYPAADPLIALIVAAVITFTAWQIFRQAASTLSDAARIPPAHISSACMDVDGVLGCHSVRTRGLESEIYVDMHVQVDPGHSVVSAHRIAEDVERAVCKAFDTVADVIVHIEPLDQYQASKTQVERGRPGASTRG